MNYTTLQDSIRLLLADITGKQTIWQKQNAPKPKKPYLAIRLFAFRGIGQDEILPSDTAPGDFIINGHRECTLEAQWIGPGAEDGLLTLQQAMQKPTIIDRCKVAGVCIDSISNITDIAILLDSIAFEERCMLEFNVRFNQQVIDNPGTIENININTTERNFTIEKE